MNFEYDVFLEDEDDEWFDAVNEEIIDKSFEQLSEILSQEGISDKVDARVNVSYIEILLGLLTFALHNSLSNKATQDLFKLFNRFLDKNILPDTMYYLNKLFTSQEKIEFQGICPHCGKFRKKFKRSQRKIYCKICKKKFTIKPYESNFLVILDVKENIKNLIEDNALYYDKIMQQNLMFGDPVYDITSSIEYLKFRNKLPEADKKSFATFVFNSDGSPVFKSSNNSIWPVQVVLNELPIDVRSKNPITWALWFGRSKPNMDMLLEAFVENMNKYSEDGVQCNINGVFKNIKLYSICCAVDSVARASMQGITQFNGHHGCSWCYHKGVSVQGKKKKVIKYIVSKKIASIKRTEKSTLQHIKLLSETQKIKKDKPYLGIKKKSPLLNLNMFKIIKGFVPDVMHSVFLGVCKQFAKHWFDDKKQKYSVKNSNSSCKIIDDLLSKIKVPKQIDRLSRKFKDRKFWKSRDWENWLLYYSLPVLSKVPGFKKQYLIHWSLLVNAIKILIRPGISKDDINSAHTKLEKFVTETQKLYGKKSMSYNVHQLLHLAQSTLDWGPLLSHSCYPFESGNGKILKMIKSANGVVHQVCRTLQFEYCASVLKKKVDLIQYSPIKEFIYYLKNNHTFKTLKFDNSKIRYFGKPILVKNKWINLLNLSEKTSCYKKICKDKSIFTSIKNNTRCDNSIAWTNKGYIQIVEFIVDHENEKEYTICKRIKSRNAFDSDGSIQLVESISNKEIHIATSKIIKIAVPIKLENDLYICDIPNLMHH